MKKQREKLGLISGELEKRALEVEVVPSKA